ncbi:hypothetical protein LR48_Vigan10g205200 [Vigna angularis]|uniref:Uncharacterized protein n=1 Tax=Phaseolus angularis TaxID=3914 RepID=A0A0L9VM80_PHAAN|nr:hypothetical protein LR48_Vigan10g205200 [Vigna angularis]
MKFLQSLIVQSRYAVRVGSLNRVSGLRFFAVSTEEYAKRNYANNVSEYNTVLGSLTSKRRTFLLRDVYEDMMLDGVKPSRDTFHSLVAGTMKAARMQDAFFFVDQMKTMGLLPDVTLYNFLISTCGKCKNSNKAIQILEEMKRMEVKPNVQTYICLLNACAADGRIDRVYTIVRDMIAAGLGLNKFCYAGLIVAHKNKTPLVDDFSAKVIEFVEKSKMWSSDETNSANAENVMMGVSDEELYNLPTADYIHRRGGFLNRPFTAYHTAFHAAADLKLVELTNTLLDMLNKDGKTPDVFIMMQVVRSRVSKAAVLSVDGFAAIRGQDRREENICENEGKDENCDGDIDVAVVEKVAEVVAVKVDNVTNVGRENTSGEAHDGNVVTLASLRLQSNIHNWLPQQDLKNLIRDSQSAIIVGERPKMKNHTLCREENTKTEGGFGTEKYSMMEEEGEATIKSVEDGDAAKQQSMTFEFWDSKLLGSEYGVQKPLSYQPPPKPPDLKLQAIASGFPSYDNTLRTRLFCSGMCYCHAGEIDLALQTFENYINEGRVIAAELFVTLAEGAMAGYTEKGMQIAQDILVRMNERNFFVNSRLGSELLLVAAGEKTGGYTTANYIWDMMQVRKINALFPAVEAYYQGLKDREIPEDDPRLLMVSNAYKRMNTRSGNRQF